MKKRDRNQREQGPAQVPQGECRNTGGPKNRERPRNTASWASEHLSAWSLHLSSEWAAKLQEEQEARRGGRG